MNLFIVKRLFLLILLSIPLSFFAQNKLDSLQLLQEVVVSAKPFSEVIPSQSLKGIELKRLNSHSVADALRYFAGVQIKDYGGLGGLKTVDVRNMGTHHVGVFYDGIQLGNMQNGVTDLGKFSLDDIEELSMYNGQKSDIFQPAKDFAAASTIYLRGKKPKFEGDKKTNLLVRYKTMTINYHDPSLRIEHKLSDRVNVSLSSQYIKSNGEYKYRYKRNNKDGTLAYDTTATRWNSDIEALRIESGVYGRLDNGTWDAKLYYYDSDRGAPGAIKENKFSDGFRQRDKNFFAQASMTNEFTEKYKFQARAKFAFDYMHYFARDSVNFLNETVTEGAQADNRYYQQEVYLSAVNMYTILPGWDVALATDFQYNKLNATLKGVGTQFSYPQRYTILYSLSSSYNLGKLKTMGSVIGTHVQERVRFNAKAPNKTELTPAIFIGYEPFDRYDLTIRSFAKRIFRMPTFNDLYYQMVGQAVLRPEYMNQYNIGFTYSKAIRRGFVDSFSLQADAYYTDTKDKIVAAPANNLFRWTMTNMGKVRGKGVEVVSNLKMHIDQVYLTTNLTYAYTESTDKTKLFGIAKSSYGDQIPYTPWHSGSAIANATYKTWDLNYSFIYVGKRYNANVNNIKVNEAQPWYTHDLSLQKVFNFKQLIAKTTVEVNNLFNQQYEVIANYPMPGRTFRFIVSLEI